MDSSLSSSLFIWMNFNQEDLLQVQWRRLRHSPSLPWGVSPFAGSHSVYFHWGQCVCVNLFSGEGITPASLAQLCCPSGMVSSFDADFYFCISWFVFQRESNMCHILTKALKGIFNVLLVHYKFLFQVGILNITCISLSAVFISRIDKIRHLASLYLKLSTFDNKLLPNFTCPGKSFHHKLIYLPQNPVP